MFHISLCVFLIRIQVVLLFMFSGLQWKRLWSGSTMSWWRQGLLRKWRHLQVSAFKSTRTFQSVLSKAYNAIRILFDEQWFSVPPNVISLQYRIQQPENTSRYFFTLKIYDKHKIIMPSIFHSSIFSTDVAK